MSSPEALQPLQPPVSPLPALDAFVGRHAKLRRARSLVRGLHAILSMMPEPSAPIEERLEWLESLGRWVLTRKGGHLLEGAVKAEDGRTGRLRFLVRLCELEPIGDELSKLLASVVSESSPRTLLLAGASADMPGFWDEAATRVAEKLLPPPPADLSQLLVELFRRGEHIAWLELLPQDALEGFARLVARGSPEALSPLRRSVREAMTLLSTRLAALGLADDFRARCPGVTLEDSPFRRLPAACDGCLSPDVSEDVARTELTSILAACHRDISRVFLHLEESGVSVDLVFRLELMTKALERMERLAALWSKEGEVKARTRMLAMVLHEARRARSLREHFRASSRQLARKIVERAGETGEHYITSTRAEYVRMLVSAGAGGLITVGTVLGKFALGAHHLPLFFDGLLFSLNYAVSFLLVQAFGATLATKQPAMTAAAIAGTLKDTSHGFEALGGLFARTVRSQLAATIGNLGVVVPMGLLFDMTWRAAMGGEAFLSEEKARYVMQSLSPWGSGTLLFAALTGALLWASSLCAGWVDNWFTYRRIPDALSRSRTLRRLFGKRGAVRLGGWLSRNIAGIGGNVSLGFLLGGVPMVGKFFGLALDVRHVTLSAGTLAVAYASLGQESISSGLLMPACVGIGAVMVVNLGVSFWLALAVAARAREVAMTDLKLFRSLAKYALRRPLEFFIPPAGEVQHVTTQVSPHP